MGITSIVVLVPGVVLFVPAVLHLPSSRFVSSHPVLVHSVVHLIVLVDVVRLLLHRIHLLLLCKLLLHMPDIARPRGDRRRLHLLPPRNALLLRTRFLRHLHHDRLRDATRRDDVRPRAALRRAPERVVEHDLRRDRGTRESLELATRRLERLDLLRAIAEPELRRLAVVDEETLEVADALRALEVRAVRTDLRLVRLALDRRAEDAVRKTRELVELDLADVRHLHLRLRRRAAATETFGDPLAELRRRHAPLGERTAQLALRREVRRHDVAPLCREVDLAELLAELLLHHTLARDRLALVREFRLLLLARLENLGGDPLLPELLGSGITHLAGRAHAHGLGNELRVRRCRATLRDNLPPHHRRGLDHARHRPRDDRLDHLVHHFGPKLHSWMVHGSIFMTLGCQPTKTNWCTALEMRLGENAVPQVHSLRGNGS